MKKHYSVIIVNNTKDTGSRNILEIFTKIHSSSIRLRKIFVTVLKLIFSLKLNLKNYKNQNTGLQNIYSHEFRRNSCDINKFFK